MPSEFISVKKVGERLGISRLTVISLINAGYLQAIKTKGTSGKWLVESNSVDVYLAKMKVERLKGSR